MIESFKQSTGIWTGHDWADPFNSIQEINGLISGTTDVADRRVAAA